jgi:hypothetical protein
MSAPWRIYYDSGQVFTSEDGAFEDAPADGVLFVLQKHGDKVLTLSGADYYAMVDGSVCVSGELGPLLRKLAPWCKFGRWTSIKKYEEIGRRVAADAKSWESENGRKDLVRNQ